MRFKKKALLLSAFISASALFLSGCSGDGGSTHVIPETTLSSTSTSQIDDAVKAAMSSDMATEAVIGVWSPSGDYVNTFTNGSDRDFDAAALFRAAQTNQPILCALVLAQVEAGELSLDREVSRDIPRQTGIGDVTYRQLCDGTSGFPDFKKKYQKIYLENPTRPWSQGQLIAESLIHKQLSWPGLDVHRSDSPAVILAHALSVRTVDSFDNLIAETVFEPAQMYNTTIQRGSQTTIPSDNSLSGVGLLPGPNCEAGLQDYSEVSPSILDYAGNTISTVTDIKNFYEHYLSGTFGGEKGLSLIKDVKPRENPKRDEEGNPVEESADSEEQTSFIGFGILKEGPLWGYNGSLPGSSTAAWHNPDTGLTIVVALNSSAAGSSIASLLAQQIAAIVGEPNLPWDAEAKALAIAEAAVCQEETEAGE